MTNTTSELVTGARAWVEDWTDFFDQVDGDTVPMVAKLADALEASELQAKRLLVNADIDEALILDHAESITQLRSEKLASQMELGSVNNTFDIQQKKLCKLADALEAKERVLIMKYDLIAQLKAENKRLNFRNYELENGEL